MDDIHRQLLSAKTVIVYGAHLVALECARWLIQNGKRDKMVGFAVTDMGGNPDEIEGFQVKRLEEYEKQRQDLTVIIATPKKYHDAIERTLREKGFCHILKISLEEMSELKGHSLLLAQENRRVLPFTLEEDENDPSWLNMLEEKIDDFNDKRRIEEKRHYKFPTLFYLDGETVFQESEKLDFREGYEKVCGKYRNLHTLPICTAQSMDIRETGKTMSIYMASSAWDCGENSWNNQKSGIRKEASWIKRIQVGSKLSQQRNGDIFDDTGDNVSDKNGTFAEMTGAYWIWKNASDTTYKGLCHYRRHFVISEEEILALEQNNIDVILTTPRYVPGGIKGMFLAETPVKTKVFEGMLHAILEQHPEDRGDFEAYVGSCFYYPNNMVIAKNGIYDSYCSWVFPVLLRMQEIDRETSYGHRNDRHIAYAAEILTSYYFVKNKEKYRIAVTDYKFTS